MGLRGNLKYSSLVKRCFTWIWTVVGGGGSVPPGPGSGPAYQFDIATNSMYLPIVL